jgi:hypothetical protein
MKSQIQLFEEKKVRTVWDEESEEWYFSIVDVVGVLTDSPNPNNYWKVLRNRQKKKEVSWLQFVTNWKCSRRMVNITKLMWFLQNNSSA